MENEKRDNYLPLGTVVLLKNGKKRLMITGFCLVPDDDKTKVFDYTGCLFPEGVINSKQSLMFNHDQIEKIYFVGLEDEEEKQFKKKLNEAIANGGLEKITSKTQNGNSQPQVTNEIRISE